MSCKILSFGVCIASISLLAACNSSAQITQESASKGGAQQIEQSPEQSSKQTISVKADIWVDNWFNLSINGQTVLEDSTPFKTERSFNSDSGIFDISVPAIVALEFRDFYETDTGLEYIGSSRQQIGDGGGAAQIINMNTGKTLFVSDESLRCKVIHRAPLDKACQFERNPVLGQGLCHADITPEPEGWMEADFDDSDWHAPTIHSANAVRPRQGYRDIDWDEGVKLIWGQDLEIDNIVLCRAVIDG